MKMNNVLSLQGLPVKKDENTDGLVTSTQSNNCNSSLSVNC
jgi:hypothetical protein